MLVLVLEVRVRRGETARGDGGTGEINRGEMEVQLVYLVLEVRV
jgi:hypothetical protein